MAQLEVWTHVETRCVCGYGFTLVSTRSTPEKGIDLGSVRRAYHAQNCVRARLDLECPWTEYDHIHIFGACAEENPPWPR